jgi:hypothetical protein
MDESDIYFVDTRNATNDHRTGGSGPVVQSGWRPAAGRPVQTIYGPPARVYAPAQPQIIYAQPPQTAAATLLGKVTAGQLVDLVAQIFAALMPLPAAPVSTADIGTDVGNLILYQGALAQYAKRDEQVRTLGNLVTKLVG